MKLCRQWIFSDFSKSIRTLQCPCLRKPFLNRSLFSDYLLTILFVWDVPGRAPAIEMDIREWWSLLLRDTSPGKHSWGHWGPDQHWSWDGPPSWPRQFFLSAWTEHKMATLGNIRSIINYAAVKQMIRIVLMISQPFLRPHKTKQNHVYLF